MSKLISNTSPLMQSKMSKKNFLIRYTDLTIVFVCNRGLWRDLSVFCYLNEVILEDGQ